LKLFVQSAAKAIQNAELHEQLLQKEKLSAVGKAVGMVMHDLRPPIQYIKILTGLLRADHVESRWLDALDQCGDQASEIFEDFLDFIKETPVKKLPVNLNKVIEEGIHMADERNSLDTITIIRRNIVPGLIIAGDESKLRRVVMNLVSNAVDILKDKKVPDPCIDISVEAVEDVHQVIIRMKDNGPGIPPEIIRTIFEPFVTKHKSNGTGLGLAIVKQYITAHGGTISVENEGGAVFTISLPY
jgi:signal transduction histidine kinase